MMANVAHAGLFTPHWSIKLKPVAVDAGGSVRVLDRRPVEQTKFRFVDFLKVTNKIYLGDINTTPARMTILAARLNASALAASDARTVEVARFEILEDTSGSACNGCALAAISPAAAIGAESGRKPSSDSFTCSLTASIDGNAQSAEIEVPFRMGAMGSQHSPQTAAALQDCVDGVIDRWLEMELTHATDPSKANATQ
jgi:hypothetical protein